MIRKLMSSAVAAACGALERAAESGAAPEGGRVEERGDVLVFDDGKDHGPVTRRLTVDLKIEAEALGDTALGHLVERALREYLDRPAGRGQSDDAMQGVFESRDGLDVSWRAINRYFKHGPAGEDLLVGESGVNEAGERKEWFDEASEGRPIPEQMPARTISILGVRYSMCVFEFLANPDPAKRYSFERSGDTVTVKEVPCSSSEK